MNSLKYFVISSLILFSNCIGQEETSCPMILSYIQENLPTSGYLRSSDGFVYVDLDDAYVHKLVTFIQAEGFEEPPYFGSPELVGAHITVVYPDEMKKYGVGKIEECGEAIHFVLKRCQVVHPLRWQGVDEAYFVVIDAPELDNVREKYGLPKREYDFHITIGIKPKMAKSA